MSAQPGMRFELLRQDGAARRGRLRFAGQCRDPRVHAGGHLRDGQGDDAGQLEEIGVEIVLGNTFDLICGRALR